VQHVAPVPVCGASALSGGQDAGARQMQPQLISDKLGGPLPVAVLLRGSSDAGHEVGGTPSTNRTNYRHTHAPAY
jgi:hypothetical protein